MKKTLLILGSLLTFLAHSARAEPLLGVAIRKLYPNADPGVDYIIRKVGAADPTITYWNPALGAQPDASQIAAAVSLVNADTTYVANEAASLNTALTKITGSTPLSKNDIRGALAALLRQKIGGVPSAAVPTNDNSSGDPVSWGAITGTLGDQSDLTTALAGKHPLIASGTTAQYRRGDNSWQTLDKAAAGLGNVDNTADTAKPVSAAQQTALNLKTDLTVLNTLLSRYITILQAAGSHIAAKVAGTYALGAGDPLAVGGTGTLYPIGVFHLVGADYPTVNGLAPKLRIRAVVNCNDTAPTGNYTIGLYPVTRPGTSGAAAVNIYTLGTVVSGSNGATVSAPAADSINNLVGSDFALPADGDYCLAVVTTATVAVAAHVHINAYLQLHNN